MFVQNWVESPQPTRQGKAWFSSKRSKCKWHNLPASAIRTHIGARKTRKSRLYSSHFPVRHDTSTNAKARGGELGVGKRADALTVPLVALRQGARGRVYQIEGWCLFMTSGVQRMIQRRYTTTRIRASSGGRYVATATSRFKPTRQRTSTSAIHSRLSTNWL